MRSLVDYLLAEGWTVSGSDQSLSQKDRQIFAAKGVRAFSEHCDENLSEQVSLLIHSLAISKQNPERQLATSRGIPTYSYVEYLGRLFEKHRGIGIAGTHGKTTTTAILAYIMRHCGEDPSLVYGGRLQGEAEFGWRGKSEYLVAECCEFRQSFLNYSPETALLSGIEQDHFDCFPNQDSLLAAFSQFCSKINPAGLLVINNDCDLTRQASQDARCRIVRFSVDISAEKPSDWQLESISTKNMDTIFSVRSPDGNTYSFEIPLCGLHQVANSLSAIIVAKEIGIELGEIAEGLKMFPGVERRFHLRGEYRGRVFIDDYAHHPTEIKATIAAARQRFGDYRLTVAFQPHQILRTESLLDQFADALSQADHVYILPIFAAREIQDSRAETVAWELVNKGNLLQLLSEKENRQFEYSPSLDHLRSSLDDSSITEGSSSSNLFLTLGAGNIDRIYHELPGFIH